jgi:hypothetical protein
MKTAQKLLLVGGIANALFFLFHLFLGWQLHHAQVVPPLRSLLEMLNGGGALFILFLTLTSLVLPTEVLTSRLGSWVLILAASLYLLRGAAEFVVAPQPTPVIYATCAVTGSLYVGALLLSRPARASLSLHPQSAVVD